MTARLQAKMLMVSAIVLLLTIGGVSASLGREVLNPLRTVSLTSTGSSILASPRVFFKTPAVAGSVGEPVTVPVLIDSNGGSLTAISATFQYNPLDMAVTLSDSATSVCRAYTSRDHDTVSGRFRISCTAPSTNASQILPFLTFIVTPHRTGGLPIELIGRVNDYGVVTAK